MIIKSLISKVYNKIKSMMPFIDNRDPKEILTELFTKRLDLKKQLTELALRLYMQMEERENPTLMVFDEADFLLKTMGDVPRLREHLAFTIQAPTRTVSMCSCSVAEGTEPAFLGPGGLNIPTPAESSTAPTEDEPDALEEEGHSEGVGFDMKAHREASEWLDDWFRMQMAADKGLFVTTPQGKFIMIPPTESEIAGKEEK